MQKLETLRKILTAAAGLVILTVILLITTIPGIIQQEYPGSDSGTAAIALSIVVILHLVLLYGYYRNIRKTRQGRPTDRGLSVGIGILLLMFSIFILDGAAAFLEHVLYVSVLMFAAVLCDLVAALATIGTGIIKPGINNRPDRQ